jgi:protease I
MKDTQNQPKVAILVADGFEQVELTQPREFLDQHGFVTEIVSPNPRTVRGMNHHDTGDALRVDVPLSKAKPEDYDALLLPGGVMNPDTLRQEPKAVAFVQSFFAERKPVAAICHGPQILIEADVLRDREITSFPSVQTDVRNAGARWVDKQVVVDGNLVTSRKPDDIPAFNKKMLELFGGGSRK